VTVQVTILAAGMGTRLGRPAPKPLTHLDDGRTILQQQVDNVRTVFGEAARIVIVVGFKHEMIMESQPDALFAYNENFDQTNTSKSLLKALRTSADGPVIWMNGDVVFDPEVLRRLQPHLADGGSALAVNTAATGEEEVKYTVDEHGFVCALSKQVAEPLGESVGINLVSTSAPSTTTSNAASNSRSSTTGCGSCQSTSQICLPSRSTPPKTSLARSRNDAPTSDGLGVDGDAGSDPHPRVEPRHHPRRQMDTAV
jgi:choline kinase